MRTLKEKRAALKAKNEALAAIKAKAKADNASAEDKAAYKAALQEIKSILDDIEEHEEEEALEARSSKAAGAPVAGEEGRQQAKNTDDESAWARPKTEDTPEFEITFCAAAMGKARTLLKSGIVKSPIDVMRDEGFGGFADQLLRRQAQRAREKGIVLKTNSTLTPQDGGILLPTPNSASIVPFLRAENTFLANNPRRVQLVGGQFNQPKGATPSAAGYVGEGAKKPVGSPTFDGFSMASKKIAGIVMVTEEVLAWSLADIRAYITDDLRSTLATNMDLAMYFGPGGVAPLGILNRTGINVFDASTTGTGALFADPKNPTVEELDDLASRMLLAITDRNITASSRFKWSMNYHLMQYLLNLRGPQSNKIYPEVAQGQWKGFDIAVTNAFPNNGGATTDESTLALVDWSNVLYGEDQDITVRTSTEASIDTGAGTVVQLFQQNMMAILMEARHDVALQRTGAVSVLRKARWGSIAA